VTEIARLRIKLAHRDDVLAILNKANIDVVALEERGDGEARIEILSKAANFEALNSIPNEWWAIRGIIC
jgi:hypothetical protein